MARCNRGIRGCNQLRPVGGRAASVHGGAAIGVFGSRKVDDGGEPEAATPCYDQLMEPALGRAASGKDSAGTTAR